MKAIPPRPPKARLGPTRSEAVKTDPFLRLNLDPLDCALNPHILTSFVSELGRLKSRAETGLTWRNQRRVGKAVRRARSMGVMSHWGPVNRSSDGRMPWLKR
jgi:small subunit ribosomal protein S18